MYAYQKYGRTYKINPRHIIAHYHISTQPHFTKTLSLSYASSDAHFPSSLHPSPEVLIHHLVPSCTIPSTSQKKDPPQPVFTTFLETKQEVSNPASVSFPPLHSVSAAWTSASTCPCNGYLTGYIYQVLSQLTSFPVRSKTQQTRYTSWLLHKLPLQVHSFALNCPSTPNRPPI